MDKKTLFFIFLILIFLGTAIVSAQDQMMRSHSSSLKKTNNTGIVLETMNSGGYTYVEIQERNKKFWAAGPAFKIKVGDKVEYRAGMEMKDFKSKTLDRTFESIMFFTYLKKFGAKATKLSRGAKMPAGHQPIGQMQTPKKNVSVKAGSIKKADKGYTVGECFTKIDELKGKKIQIRGIVVKVSRGIMKKNWIHLQDGTGKIGQDDLVVTTVFEKMNTGDQILVKGHLIADKDFGAGYKYQVIMENAEVTIETPQNKGDKK